jgi:predicted transcriptional regulator
MTKVKRREGLYGFEYLIEDRRRLPEDKPRKVEIQSLWQRSHEIVNLAARGLKYEEIASFLNISRQCVSDTLNSELGKHKLAEIRRCRDEETKVVSEKIRHLTNKALKVYNDIFDDESGECNLNDKKKAADTVILELSGLRAPTKVQTTNTSMQLSKEDLERFKARALKAAEEAGIVIDIEKPKEITSNTEINGFPEQSGDQSHLD